MAGEERPQHPYPFEVMARDGLARCGVFTTPHGKVHTPALLPVINPRENIIPPNELAESFGCEILITNSYIIRSHDELRKVAVENGVHGLLGWDGPVMTDSGTFQSYVYNGVEVAPEEIIAFQKQIGTDIGTILDVFTLPTSDEDKARAEMEETVRRARQAAGMAGDMGLAITVQGGRHPNLREECARAISPLQGAVFPIGGVVPVMERMRYSDLVDIIMGAKRGLAPGRPVHLFGAGHPSAFALAAALGCDLFDSSAYIKFARDGRMLTVEGTIHLEDLSELPCSCPNCINTTPRELLDLNERDRTAVLARHNLHVSFEELKRVRSHISQGNIWELVIQRAGSHPSLAEALIRLRDHGKQLEHHASTSRKRFMVTSSLSLHRAEFIRYQKRVMDPDMAWHRNWPADPDNAIELRRMSPRHVREELERALSGGNLPPMVESHLGPLPPGLLETYPFSQAVFPLTTDEGLDRYRAEAWDRYRQVGKGSGEIPSSKYNTDVKTDIMKGKKPTPYELYQIAHVLDWQFGPGSWKVFDPDRLGVVRSRSTRRMQNVYLDGKHILSLRALDGLFTLKWDGAVMLHDKTASPRHRVVVTEEASAFNATGKNVFSRFVMDCDPLIRPGDEVTIVDPDDGLVAVGRAHMVQEEMVSFSSGLAVRTREGLGSRESVG